mmetsp:Transcript_47304/g.78499  ORF Transcript_47304/g.78499 Transcript_47304/m.78499 type:complete len:175 (-) Transcript_47304:61-585(-)
MIAFVPVVLLLDAMIGISSALHAHCFVTLTIENTTINAVNQSIIDQVEARVGFDSASCVFADQKNEFCGYSVISLGDTNHFQHETPTKHYVDDIMFEEWEQQGTTVKVVAHSKSQPTSIYDYDTNFCNIFNLFRDGAATKMNFDLKSIALDACTFHPSDLSNGFGQAFSQCDTY